MLLKLVLCLALAVAAVPALADTSMTKLNIHVVSLADKPVDRASVVVTFVEGRSIVKLGKKQRTRWEIRTNQDGIAKIPTLPQGKVRVQVIAKGYQTFGDTFEVDEENENLKIKLNPPQPQYSAHE